MGLRGGLDVFEQSNLDCAGADNDPVDASLEARPVRKRLGLAIEGVDSDQSGASFATDPIDMRLTSPTPDQPQR